MNILKIVKTKLLLLASLGLAMAGVTVAQPHRALADDAKMGPKTKPDNAFVSVSGTIVSTTPNAFRLDYGKGVITVEMDDFDPYPEGRALMENDKVIVNGVIDDDLFEKRTIEASSVYVESLQTHFFASSADEEGAAAALFVSTPIVTGQFKITGTVSEVDGREFTVNTGQNKIRVDTWTLGYNPMDDSGYQRIEVGDRVRVGGDFEPELLDKLELVADWIVELRDSGKDASS